MQHVSSKMSMSGQNRLECWFHINPWQKGGWFYIKKTLWLNDRQPVKVLKSLNDWQSDIFLKFKESKEDIQLKLWYVY